ncbi:MAG: molybdopterin molybdotransferase MoeA [Candidatus Eremiobacteraeota bacterium]|nr:molybdopterin molybdotransferase MoeA [Candidatus Eremiobacteraeota bacterium]
MRSSDALLPSGGFAVEKLLAPEQALIAFFARANLTEPATEAVDLTVCAGRTLAAPIRADADYPAAARSTMDGFALHSSQTPGRLRVAGAIPMGKSWNRSLQPGTALEIPTGGLLPVGCDAVVPIEDVRIDGDYIVVHNAVPVGDALNAAGSDMHSGELILEAGRRIGPAEVGLLAALGVTAVPVFHIPTVAVLSSGDELVEPSQRPGPGQIRDSNRYAVAAELAAMRARVVHYPIVSDEAGALEKALAFALAQCDGVVVSGGSSVGQRDRTPAAVAALGEPGVIVHGLRVKPGKPTVLGAIGGKPIIGLPGNPVSALLILKVVVAPIIAALTGQTRREAPAVPAVAAESIAGRPGWTSVVPVRLEWDGPRHIAHPLVVRSANVSLLARASGFVRIGETQAVVATGEAVMVNLL